MFRELLETVTQDVEANPDNVNEHRLQVNDTLENEVVNGGEKKRYRKQLLEALDKEDPDEVLELIRVDGFRNKQNAKTLKTLNDNAKDEQQTMENFDEEEREWIKILSDPLYISLKWFWRIYTIPSGIENEEQDVIVSALRDSRLLQMIAGNDLHQHNKEYQGRADEIEEFAIAVVEGSTHEQLRDIMDTQGGGCLKQKNPENFSQSLGVLKIAADLERIKFVASDKCQTILNEVIYFQWRGWQKKNRTPKILWSIVQLLLFTIPGIPLFYMILRLSKEFCGVIATHQECRPGIGMGEGQRGCCEVFRLLFEHPYSKFVNHTMFYLVFLGFLIAASFEEEFGTTDTGLVWIGQIYLLFLFTLGFLVSCHSQHLQAFTILTKIDNKVEIKATLAMPSFSFE